MESDFKMRREREEKENTGRVERVKPTETATQRMRRLEKKKQKRSLSLCNETPEQHLGRLDRMRQRNAETRSAETPEKRQNRLDSMRQRNAKTRAAETPEQRQIRLVRQKQRDAERKTFETPEQRNSRLISMRQYSATTRAGETPEQRQIRLVRQRQRNAGPKTVETPEKRQIRLVSMRQRNAKTRAAETPEQRQIRLGRQRQRNAKSRATERADAATFERTINTFCDNICEICTKHCYPHQVTNYRVNDAAPQYLPPELIQKPALLLCHRCNKHITSRKRTSPPKAYWNNLDPGPIPDVIQQLTQPEQRLLTRIIPFMKIFKFDGLFGQYGFRGQAVLFAQDIFEVSEKLPIMLPRSTDNAGIVIVTEYLENLNITREFSISRSRVFAALQWLVANNPLYGDVTIDDNARINELDIIRVTGPAQQEMQQVNSYMPINELSRIVRATWHQGNEQVFTPEYAGAQCCSMVLANIVRASITPPHTWSTNILDTNMIEGDKMNLTIRMLTERNNNAYALNPDGYMEVRNFDVIKRDFIMYDKAFSIEYDDEPSLYGSLQHSANDDNIGLTLREALERLFTNHKAGILVAASKSLGVMNYNGKYYFTDSHSCGPKGSPALINGSGCVIECDTTEELLRICMRATGTRNEQYTLNHIDVHEHPLTQDEEASPLQEADTQPLGPTELVESIPVQTSVMAPIDFKQPDVEEEVTVSEHVNQIVRGTEDNIVHEAQELKAEEFAWYSLFPHGVNGMKEETRQVEITPLDYFQYRLLGTDTRFQRNDYLFYALSTFEYHRVKSTIAAFGKKIQDQDGAVEDVHLHLKNLRGSAAYWGSALKELLAQIRFLGPPTYFITLSSNDLNWLDMRKALLIADGRPDEDPTGLDIAATQRFVERYPVTVSRHFMVRINAFIKFIRNNHEVLRGRVKDYWWRIEFQNRGSPHLHMVVWIENYPSFETEEGIQLLDEVASCRLPPHEEDPELYGIVKKSQIHRHTHTCKKNNTHCRFAFPRQECAETRLIAHSSDEFISNGGRICLLKRRNEDKWVNNYNPTLLKLWKGNMDIQPCGSNEAIAYYVAKNISKSEPTQLDSSVAEAIQQIQHEKTNISKKVFRICMQILNERQVSACESAFRLCHLNLRDSSRKCTFLNTRKPELRYKVLKFDQSGRATGFCNNIFERYVKRPAVHTNYDFKNMSLLEFAMLFEPYYHKQQDEDEESVDRYVAETEPPLRRRLITLDNNNQMIIRRLPSVVRVPYFVAASDAHYYSLLLQYMPYREESEILGEYDTSREAFLANEQQLRQMSEHMDLYRARDQQLESAFNRIHAFQILDEQPPHLIDEIEEEQITEQPSMNDDQFHAAQRAMNAEQISIFADVSRSIHAQQHGCTEYLRKFITGNAGTGKTFLFKLLREQCNRCYGKPVVKVCALTGVAACLVQGSTLHSTLKLPVQKNGRLLQMPMLTGECLRSLRLQWKDILFLFIDEISMVPYEMLCMIDSRLKQLKNNEEAFGGINVLLFGDLLQLPPIGGNQVFDQPERMIPATHLWQLFGLVELTENMRQQGSTTFIDILNALRIGELRAEHFAVLEKNLSEDATGEFSIEKALRIYPTNEQVNVHNKAVLEHFRSQGVRIYKIYAQDQIVNATQRIDNITLERIIPSDINMTGGLPKELELFEGAKIMLRSNIDVSKGLVNGATGFIVDIIWPNFRGDQVNATDIPSIRVNFGNNAIHVIQPKSTQFPAKFSYGTAERRMLPVILSWASTVHKISGSTVDKAVVYLGSKLFAQGQAYVALSRVRSLEGLRIEALDNSKLTGNYPCNQDALTELDRMRGTIMETARINDGQFHCRP